MDFIMDNNITAILNSLIQNGLISQGHVFVLIIIVVLFAFRKLINPVQPQNQSQNPSQHDCIMIKEHEVKLNTIIDKINDIILNLQTIKSSFENLDKKIDSNVYDIKIKLTETNQDIQKLENIKELLTTFIAKSIN